MIGSTFGHYRLLEKIGQGGMGEVFLAYDTSLQRNVALKFLPPTLAADPEAHERFLVEARAAAALSHPNVCVIHEVGEAEGRPFIAMEYVEGETLSEKIRAGPLGHDRVLSIMTQLASGLEAAHRAGIIHRDIKSGNVMVTGRGQTKIMDFGLAKIRGGPALTKTHTTMGTAGYMSPEQAGGEDVDQRSDLWSLGVVLYEMLTGVLPFSGKGEPAVIYHILTDPPRPFPDLKPPVPPELRRMVAKALQKEPGKRYQAAVEVLEDLRRYHETLGAEAASAVNLQWFTSRLRQARIAVPTTVMTIALAVGAYGLSRHRTRVRWAREVAIPQIGRMVEQNDTWRNLVRPYRLAERVEAVMGDDPELTALFAQVSRKIDIVTDPPGATVSYKEYVTPDSGWEVLGTTPMKQVRVPIGIFRWKLEKPGYGTVLAAAATWSIGEGEAMISGHDLVRRLDRVGSLPEGMVRVLATKTPLGTLPDFFIGRHEVTNREYKAFVDAGGYQNEEFWKEPFEEAGRELTWEEARRAFVDRTGQPGPSTWTGGDYPRGQDDYPVSGVSWFEAAAYAAYAGRSLPTAEHWEVARGGYTPTIQWPQLGGFGVFAPFANFGGSGPVPVESLPGITAYGAYDMPGNVREWCWNETSAGRVIRGGAWEDNTYAFGSERQAPPMDRSPRNGLRLALYPDRAALPDAVFGFREPELTFDARGHKPVTDAAFAIYREQFAYDPKELDAEVVYRRKDPEGWTHELVSFAAAYGKERVLGHLFLPANATPPYQTVVYFPGDASAWMPSSEALEDYYEFTMFLSFLVRNGRAVFYPVYKGTFERGGPDFVSLLQDPENWNTHAYTECLIQIVKDLRRSLDYLETRSDIDEERLAYYGMSWGAAMGAIILAVDDRFEASVLIAGGLVGIGRPEVSDLTFVTRVRTPTLMLNGKYDVLSPPETSSRPMVEFLGTAPEDKRLVLYETDHIPPRTEYIKETLAWLDEYLGPVKR